MAKFIRYLILAALAFGSRDALLHGAADGVPELSCKFTVFSTGQIEPLALAFATVEKAERHFTPLVFFPTVRSPAYAYHGPAPVQIYDARSHEVVAEAAVSADIKEALLILLPIHPTPAQGHRYSVYVLDDSLAKHGAGGLAVVNFSGLELVGMLDRTKVRIGKDFFGPVAVGSSVKIQLDTMFKDRAVHAYGDKIKLGRNGRALLILLPPFYKGSLELQHRVLLDEPEAKPEKGKSQG